MTMQYVSNYIDKKIYQDSNFIKFTYYELRVKENLSEKDTEILISLAKQRLINKKYLVYTEGESYTKDGKKLIVQTNELLVAIKL